MRRLKKELWPYCVAVDVEELNSDMFDIEIWLGETIGCFKDRWNAVYKANGTDFYFRNGSDATMFTLRWA